MPQVTFTYVAFVLWMSCSCLSFAQTLEIDTIETANVESDHYKIRMPKVANIESYKILFRNYGVFTELEIDGEIQQFVGDYNNIQRTKTINQKIKKQGIEPTLITYFKKPELKINEVAVSQQAITGELTDKSLSFSRKVIPSIAKEDSLMLLEEKNIPTEQAKQNTAAINEPKKSSNKEKPKMVVEPKQEIADQKYTLTDLEKQSESATKETSSSGNKLPTRRGATKKSSKNNPVTQNTPTENIEKRDSTKIVSDLDALPFMDTNLPEKLPNSGAYVLLLPLVDNPQVYQIVLKDLGHVQHVELDDGSLWHYFGFFDSTEMATSYIPQLNKRGFVKDMPIVPFKAIQQEAQLLYNQVNVPVEQPEDKIDNEKVVQSKTVDITGEYFRIELPKVNNPEIFFKAFEDVGNAHSEIAPNGEPIYYIGAFETTETAIKRLEDLKPRGLTNGSIIRFSGKHRINPYRKYQLNEKKDISKQIEELKPEKKEPLIKTNPKGTYQIILGQVDNPEVFKEVFGDIGKIKVGYLEDETEFFYLGNYYVKEDAEFVVKQLKERGLTQMELLSTQPENTPAVVQPLADKVNSSSSSNSNLGSKTKPVEDIKPVANKPAADISLVQSNTKSNTNTKYRILLGQLENPKFYQNILKDFGTITLVQKEDAKLYYLESFATMRVAQLVIEEIRDLGIETALEVEQFIP